MEKQKKQRLDVLLVEKGLAPSREKAKAIIMAGIVYVDGNKEDKAGTTFPVNAVIEIKGKTLPYVSRGGLKLERQCRNSRSHCLAKSAWMSALRPADLQIVCCKTERQKSTQSMSDMDSLRGSFAMTSG